MNQIDTSPLFTELLYLKVISFYLNCEAAEIYTLKKVIFTGIC